MLPIAAIAGDRWELSGPDGIQWNVAADGHLPHEDHIEMSGKRISTVVFFGADANRGVILHRQVIWPMLRTIPNNTRGSLGRTYDQRIEPKLTLDGAIVTPILDSVRFDGVLTMTSEVPGALAIQQKIFPSADEPAAIECWTVRSVADKPITLGVSSPDATETTDAAKGVYGSYVLTAKVDHTGAMQLTAGQTCRFALVIAGRKANEPEIAVDPAEEEDKRRALIATIGASLQLETPDPIIDRMFALSKLRTSESIYATKAGLMHSPGGGLDAHGKNGRYYAAIWCNDQGEYAGPFFPFEGYADGNDASLNAYRLFARYMNPNYKSIPSSIVAEATGIWHGAGDRGDDAMLAYGASRFALARGDRKIAEELWPLVQWCLEYCHRKLNAEGVVTSDHDELEGRLPAGKANLHTSVLTYDALLSAADMVGALGLDESIAADYEQQAATLRQAIDRYFSANVEGFETYRYYDGDEVLRAWICSPLTAGIMDRKDGTIAALTSARLWGADGLTTASGRKDFWDRSTLYALRGMFIADEADTAIKFMDIYSEHRLLGEHVPYAVEAYPEGNQSHLAAESALYARIVTEGMFGIRPSGLDRFICKPELASSWTTMTLKHIKAFGGDFDLSVERNQGQIELTLTAPGHAPQEYQLSPGASMEVQVPPAAP